MQVLNLTNPEKSDIKYTISRFPDGEVQITLGKFSHKGVIKVYCRITNAEELFILMQVADILNRHEVKWYLSIYYLMGARMDRVMDFNCPYTLKIVCNIIKNLGCESIYILEPHSDVTYSLTDSNNIYLENDEYYKLYPGGYSVYQDYLVIYPDKGAYDRYMGAYRYTDANVGVAEKVRNPETGAIESIKITNPEIFKDNTKPIMVVDDLCDGGGTFIRLAEEIRKYTDQKINLFVTHMVNPNGIMNTAKVYNHVYFTNSFTDWDKLPINVTKLEIV